MSITVAGDVVRPSAELAGADRDARFAESALVARLRHRDDAAFEMLVRTYGPRMLAVARRYVPLQDDAEDVLQSAFLLVFRFIDGFEGTSKLSTWLHRIVVNCALMRIRSGKRRGAKQLDVTAFDEDSVAALGAHVGASVADDLAQRETHERLRQAVGRLPDKDRESVRLHHVTGLTIAETAHRLGRSRSAVKSSVCHGRIALRTMLAPCEEVLHESPRTPRLTREACAVEV